MLPDPPEPTNSPPGAFNQSILVPVNSSTRFVLGGTDEDGSDKMNFSIVSQPRMGTILSFSPNGTGIYRINPTEAGVTIHDSFKFEASDNEGSISDPATVTIRSASSGEPTLEPAPSPSPTPEPSTRSDLLTLMTDKKSYGFRDYVNISGTVAQPVKGSTVRLDVYDPEGSTFTEIVMPSMEDPMPPDKPQSNIKVSPDADGSFSHTFRLSAALPEYAVKGNYTVEATYQGQTAETRFILR